jgi:gliding motility-associated lipoprotein GldD
MKNVFFFVVILFVFLSSCSEKEVEKGDLPRPKGFNLIPLPAHRYVALEKGHPYTFEISTLAEVRPDTLTLGNKERIWTAEPHWIYVYYPAWNAFIQITYKNLGGDQVKMKALIKDSYKLAYKHQGKASGIQEYVMTTKRGKKAGLIELEGEVATSFQFFSTDSSRHFIRGAVYVNTATANDSLAPIIRYLKQDAMHLIQTLQWK